MMYKKIFFLGLIATVLSFSNAYAQFSHHPELKKIDKHAELLLDSAAKHMVLFILTKNTSDFDKAQNLVSQADTLNNQLERKAMVEYKVTQMDSYIFERDEEIKSYANKDLKQDILNEKTTTEHVHFKGGHYNIGTKSKEYFAKFMTYLPKN